MKIDDRIIRMSKWMIQDIRKAVDEDSRYLAVIGVMVYIEAIKRFEKVNLKTRRLDRDAFIEGMKEMNYTDTEAKTILNKIRNKMAHIYLPESVFVVVNDHAPSGKKGIFVTEKNKKPHLIIFLKTLLQEFQNEVNLVRKHILKDKSLKSKIENEMTSIYHTSWDLTNSSSPTQDQWTWLEHNFGLSH